MIAAESYRYTVSTQQAELCADFMADRHFDGELDFDTLPPDLEMAMRDFLDSNPTSTLIVDYGMTSYQCALEEVRQQIERWLLIDRDVCVGLLGPGLELES